jgi:hypothetical protein
MVYLYEGSKYLLGCFLSDYLVMMNGGGLPRHKNQVSTMAIFHPRHRQIRLFCVTQTHQYYGMF